nr:immunoglobulin light chain junction region [Macaca mulatta]MOV95107.1 immunoglobulin light chain junction region [Macaca mulatta]MOV98535.1 immunoglobulin light chain junction region [Macaca mulatta]MOV99482.1 immunoglobulin light chain junction region [Macaca mulatta]MOV99728.1 immunoglobulin light chain junction region [Macaca mulatta]
DYYCQVWGSISDQHVFF